MKVVTRRAFLRGAGALAAAPLVALADERPDIAYVDGLCFFSPSLDDLKKSGLTAFVLDASSGEMKRGADGQPRFFRTYDACLRSIKAYKKKLDEAKDAFLATKGGDIAKARKDGRVAVFLQFQGCDPLGEDLTRMNTFYGLGLRVLQLTHHFDNALAGGALEVKTSGLTALGKQAVERMNELGIVPDVSHGSDETMVDVARVSKKPVILSHGAARALVNNARCAPDEAIRAIAGTGGVVGIFMMSFWLTDDPKPTVDHLIRQVRHVIKIGGLDAVGIANDYTLAGELNLAKLGNDNAEGVKLYHPWWKSMARKKILGYDKLPNHVVIPELNDVRRMFTIHRALEKARFKPSEIEKIMGGNWTRVLTGTLG